MNLKPSAILFDMDGVLVDSLDSWWQALNAAIQAFHHTTISREEFIETYWGHDLRENLRRLHLNPEVASFCNAIYGDHIGVIKIYPDTKPTLEKLQQYPKAVITNTPEGCARQILDKFDIKRYFSVVITSDDVKRAKPNPEIVFKACDELGVNPKSVVLVGDTDSDVKAGRAAGCTVVGVNIAADLTIHSLSELTSVLG